MSSTAKPPICASPPSVPRAADPPAPDKPCRPLAAQSLPHVTYLLLALAVAAASSLLDVQDADRVVLPQLGITIPATCRFRQFTGVPCPGCGLTRAFISLAHGRLSAAWSYHPGGILFFALVLFQIPYRVWQLVRLRRGQAAHRFAVADRWVLASLAVVMLAQWAYAVIHTWGAR
ncbi:MAG: DUF2752 domain-containing protein [Pirellulaceae bacterium]|jgi:hypothetical protein|nr:DUF2752 domain-containing protein [Pirellulaceae bacterium]